jgi:hypothetical protein
MGVLNIRSCIEAAKGPFYLVVLFLVVSLGAYRLRRSSLEAILFPKWFMDNPNMLIVFIRGWRPLKISIRRPLPGALFFEENGFFSSPVAS